MLGVEATIHQMPHSPDSIVASEPDLIRCQPKLQSYCTLTISLYESQVRIVHALPQNVERTVKDALGVDNSDVAMQRMARGSISLSWMWFDSSWGIYEGLLAISARAVDKFRCAYVLGNILFVIFSFLCRCFNEP